MKSGLMLSEPELSDNALTVLESRYLSKDESGNIIETPGEMLWRVAKNVALMDVLYDSGHESASVEAVLPELPDSDEQAFYRR